MVWSRGEGPGGDGCVVDLRPKERRICGVVRAVGLINELEQAMHIQARAGQTRLDRLPRVPYRFVEKGHIDDVARQAEGSALTTGRRATANSDVPVNDIPSNSVKSAGRVGTLTIWAPRTHERPQPGNGHTIIIEVLDHVQGQHGVTRPSDLAEGLSQVGLHQASARAVELLERPPGDIHAQTTPWRGQHVVSQGRDWTRRRTRIS